MSRDRDLIDIHRHLIQLGFPYHSFSVFRMDQEEVNRVTFNENIRYKVTPEVRVYLKSHNTLFSFGGAFLCVGMRYQGLVWEGTPLEPEILEIFLWVWGCG